MSQSAKALSSELPVQDRLVRTFFGKPLQERLLQSAEQVDRLIDDRAGELFEGRLGGVRQLILRELLHYRRAVRIGARVLDLDSIGPLEFMRRYLAMRLRIDGIEHVPRRGGFMMVVNHPTGIADGIAVYALLKSRRPDMIFFANKDILDVVPSLAGHIIPVEWEKSKRSPESSRAILMAASRACKAGRAVVLFPSGRLGHLSWRGLRERPWQPTAVSLARKFDMPIVPVHLGSHNSPLFYLFSWLSNELRDITLLHELLNKRHAPIRIRVGETIDPYALPGDAIEATTLLQRYVEAGLHWPAEHRAPTEALVSS